MAKKTSRYKILFFVIALFGGTVLAGTFSIVNTTQGIKFYPKNEFSYKSAYVDMTNTSFIELRNHPELVQRMVHKGDIHLLPGGSALQKVAEFGIEVNEAIRTFDSEYRILSSIEELNRIGSEKFREWDDQYNLEERARELNEKLKTGAQEFNEWLKRQ